MHGFKALDLVKQNREVTTDAMMKLSELDTKLAARGTSEAMEPLERLECFSVRSLHQAESKRAWSGIGVVAEEVPLSFRKT